MKAVLALAASLSLASASLLPRQLGNNIPQCALGCAVTSLGSTGCQTTDFACICRATAFIDALVPCVTGSCSATEIEATIQAASELCSQAGVTLSIPPLTSATGAASSSAPASTSEAASTETEASTTAPPETTAASTEAETSMASTTEAPATTVPGNATQTTTGTGTRPPTATGTEPGAASRNTVALGGLGAIVALVAAFL